MADLQAEPLLLDTHTLIWYVFGELRPDVAERLIRSANAQQLLTSPIAAWEIGLLGRSRRRDSPAFHPSPAEWFRTALARTGIIEVPFSSAMALDATDLPGAFHKDPADRFLVATARQLGVPLVTRDERILAYAAAGHVRAIPC